jgi:TRAP transporter TAXI family solute receptor
MMKKLTMVFAISLTLALGIGGSGEAASPMRIMMGVTPTVSSHYAYGVAVAKTINENVPEVNVTAAETGGTPENLQRIHRGEFQMSLMSFPTAYAAYNGIFEYKKNPMPELRELWAYCASPITMVVREDSNIKTVYDLSGKRYNPSGKGTSSEKMTEQAFNALGIKPNWYRGGIDDAVAAVKDRRIVGYTKVAAAQNLPDATTLDLMTFTKIRVLGFSQADIDKILKAYPHFPVIPIQAGTYSADWNKGPILTIGVILAYGTTKSLPEEIAYKMVKAIWEHKAGQEASFSAFKKMTPDSVKLMTIPLHPGAVRFYKERGIDLPKVLIPPEMK